MKSVTRTLAVSWSWAGGCSSSGAGGYQQQLPALSQGVCTGTCVLLSHCHVCPLRCGSPMWQDSAPSQKAWRWQSRSPALRTQCCSRWYVPQAASLDLAAWPAKPQSKICETLRHINSIWPESISSVLDSLLLNGVGFFLQVLRVRPSP